MADTTFSMKDPNWIFLILNRVYTVRNSFQDEENEIFCKELSRKIEGIKL